MYRMAAQSPQRVLLHGVIAATMAGSGVLAAAPGAAAAPACAAAVKVGTTAAGDVYEVDATADCDFAIPADATTLEALLVGAGGGGAVVWTEAYAGGGGAVKVVDLTGATGVVAAIVGAGGAPDVNGGASSVNVGAATHTAEGGFGASQSWVDNYPGGSSGNNNAGSEFDYSGAGGGAGGPAFEANGGPGVTPASLVAGTSLFAGVDTCYGGGGAFSRAIGEHVGTATCGGGTATVAPVVNSGGGSGIDRDGVERPGADGRVVIRYAVPKAPVAPAAPVITSPKDGSTVTAPVTKISGTGTPGATITEWLLDGDEAFCTNIPVTVSAQGTWSCTLKTPITALGEHTWESQQQVGDLRGDVGSSTFTIVAAPTSSSSAAPSSSSAVPTTAPVVTTPVASPTPTQSHLANTGPRENNLSLLGLSLVGLGGVLIAAARGRRRPLRRH